jgi:hypothetical protein
MGGLLRPTLAVFLEGKFALLVVSIQSAYFKIVYNQKGHTVLVLSSTPVLATLFQVLSELLHTAACFNSTFPLFFGILG